MSSKASDIDTHVELCLYPLGRTYSHAHARECRELVGVGEMELVHIARVARAVEMMMSASKSMKSLHNISDNNENIRKTICDLRKFIHRREKLRLEIVARCNNYSSDLIRGSENNFRVGARRVIEQILGRIRIRVIDWVSDSKQLGEVRALELASARIRCDNTFADVVDSSGRSFQAFAKKSCDNLDALCDQQISYVLSVKEDCLQRHHDSLDGDLEDRTGRLNCTLSAIAAQWESEDMNRENMKDKLKQLKQDILRMRRLRLLKRRSLLSKRSEDRKVKSGLVRDIVQIQNTYMRLVDKSRTLEEQSNEKYIRILLSDRKELVDLMSEIWTSYQDVVRKFKYNILDDSSKVLMDQIITKSPDQHDTNPFGDILKLNETLLNHITRIYADLDENQQKLRSRKKIP